MNSTLGPGIATRTMPARVNVSSVAREGTWAR
jgi:hypothetical protein